MLHSEMRGCLSPEAIAQVLTWTRQAGRIALRHFGAVEPQVKADGTLVTRADLEIEQFLAAQIQATFPDHGLLSEEQTWGQIETGQPIWVIDPLDGSTAYTQGLPGWGISIGLLDRGQPYFGLFYMPLLDDLSYATVQGQYWSNQHLGRTVCEKWGLNGFLAVGTSVHRYYQIDHPHLRALGSTGASLVYTARGTAGAAFIDKAYLWDLVAGAAMLSLAGGELRYLSGQPLNYLALADGRLAPEPIIAGHPDLLTDLSNRIRPLPKTNQ